MTLEIDIEFNEKDFLYTSHYVQFQKKIENKDDVKDIIHCYIIHLQNMESDRIELKFAKETVDKHGEVPSLKRLMELQNIWDEKQKMVKVVFDELRKNQASMQIQVVNGKK